MTYDFAMDKKTVISVLAGGVVMAVLFFAAGWIVGLYWTTSSASAATAGKTATASENEQAALPKEPVLREDAAQTDVASPGKATATARQEIAPPGGVAAAPPPPSAAAGRSAAGNTAATAPAVAAQEKIVQAADPDLPALATSTGSDDEAGNSVFTVQVGVFLDPNEAGRLLGAMEKHGYAPKVFTDKDAENRKWYAIRIGAYSDKDQAATAAANFTRQESIKAVVRPLGSL